MMKIFVNPMMIPLVTGLVTGWYVRVANTACKHEEVKISACYIDGGAEFGVNHCKSFAGNLPVETSEEVLS